MATPSHRVTISGTRTRKGVPVKCSCGWSTYCFTVMGAYAAKREHAATHEAKS